MAELSDNTNWSETDASNNKTSPNGWPEGMMPSGVNDSARADKGALKRFWDRTNPVQQITPSGGVWQFNTGNTAYPASYIDGEVYAFRALAASAAGDSFQVNGLGTKPIWKAYLGGWSVISAGDIQTRSSPRLVYDSTLNGGAGAFVLQHPYVPVANGYTFQGNGIVYPGVSHSIGFNWDGGHITGSVDGSGTPGQLANVADLGGYLPLSGGTISGNLSVTSNFYIGGCQIYNNGGWVDSPQGFRATGNGFYADSGDINAANGNLRAAGSLFVGGIQVYNNGGYLYSPSAMRTPGLVVDGQIIVSGNVNASLFCGPGGTTGNIKCWPGSAWGNMAFAAISGGYLGVSADNGNSGFNYAPNGSWSDARLKTDIRDSKFDALAAILATPVRAYGWNEEGLKLMPWAEPVPVGLVAQEVEEAMPFVVKTMPPVGGADARMIKDELLTPVLFRAIQQLAARLKALEKK